MFFTTLRKFVYGTPFTHFIFIVCGYRKQSFDRWKRHRRDSVTFDERIHIEIESLNFYIISVTRQARSFTEGIVRCSFFFKSLHQQSLTIFFLLFSRISLLVFSYFVLFHHARMSYYSLLV